MAIGWKQILGGLFCVLLIVISWLAMAVIISELQKGSKYNKPYFLTYIVRAGYSISVPCWALWYFYLSSEHAEAPPAQTQQITRKLLLSTLGLATVSGACAYTWYRSLPLTAVSTNTAIYNCSPTAVFLLSIFTLNERVTIYKVISVFLCLAGVVIVAIYGSPNTEDSADTILGILLVAASALLFAVYEVFYGLTIAHEITVSKNFLVLGLVGVLFSFFGIPVFILLHYTGWETFQIPLGRDCWAALATVGLDLVMNLALSCGVYLTSPLFMSLGSLLTVPVSVVVDKIRYDFVLPWPAFIGMGFIAAGFILMNVSEHIGFMKETRYTWQFRKNEEPASEMVDDLFIEKLD